MKSIILLSLSILLMSAVNAQISLQYSLPSINNASFSIIKFGLAGDQYVLIDYSTNQITVYNLNQVLEKTIDIPASVIVTNYQVYYISDNLFDLDSSLEYLVNKPIIPGVYSNTYIVKEDGTILLEADSAIISNFTNPNLISDFANVYPTPDGTKLILYKKNSGYQVYSLPGTLPCHECNNGVFTGNFSPENPDRNGTNLSNPFPNPTDNLTRIDYNLPKGINQGELIFFNTNGVEVKRFNVSNVFSFIYVSANDLPQGTYFFTLKTTQGITEGKKLVVVK
ncbi:MAG: T9SS type A sorting domain-containing protein [Chitinophagaceae bacterium]|nr:T9SS type A sorting domain-containing protein [Chitinophagaceae bacterium]